MQRGFTLIELLVTVGIFAIIVSISIPLYAKYTHKAYRATVISDVKNTAISVEAFIGDFKSVPNSVNCPASGYGPASCDLTDGSNTLSDAIYVSKDAQIQYVKEPSSCNGLDSYKIHGIHAKLDGWGYCFSACNGAYLETDGSGCP